MYLCANCMMVLATWELQWPLKRDIIGHHGTLENSTLNILFLFLGIIATHIRKCKNMS